MNKLISQLQRLYFLPVQPGSIRTTGQEAAGDQAKLTTADIADSLRGERRISIDPGPAGAARCLVVEFRQATDWPQVASLCQGLHDDLELPLPAISVGAAGGYQLWFSLAEAIPLAQAQRFLAALRHRYLGEISESNLRLHPASEARSLELVPALDEATGKWSAFIDPGLGEMFMVEGGLEMAPNMDRQADLLSRIKSLSSEDVQGFIDKPESDAGSPADSTVHHAAEANPSHHAGTGYSDPQSFLLAVMNDPTATTRDRIEAAKALLPGFADRPSA